jgi:peptidyl-tRNA hydrolase
MFFSKKPKWLVVGLGNPGSKYKGNRHNAGFLAVDFLLDGAIPKLKFSALTATAEVSGQSVMLMKPQTFMNNSGEAVAEAARFYKIAPENIIVIYDDVSFTTGRLRVRGDGSAGGHNGMKSIIQCLGADEFPRVKLGVGQKPERWQLADWVLSDFTDAEIKDLSGLFPKVKEIITDIINGQKNLSFTI